MEGVVGESKDMIRGKPDREKNQYVLRRALNLSNRMQMRAMYPADQRLL